MALDLMEELRPYLVDRLALSLINTRQISLKDFEVKESRAVLLNEDGRKKVIQAWQSRKQEQIIHPYLQEKLKLGLYLMPNHCSWLDASEGTWMHTHHFCGSDGEAYDGVDNL